MQADLMAVFYVKVMTFSVYVVLFKLFHLQIYIGIALTSARLE
jgi:hypothetical protein